ncbi:PRC-barrel domain-containing protein [Actinotalea ferrariae]|uniref:PRC-barrel domain-containing protein n=1 Tax=Actinotalea ferrariae TaxID=1386098 RepID=UPI001C8C1479|nr:PRC-barrel domain-containing protein [Actinotalea ferrariae]
MLTSGDIDRVLNSGGAVVTTAGERLGTLTQVFRDARTGGPAWGTVTTGLLGRAEAYVPLVEASVRGDALVVPYDAATVDGAPRVTGMLGDLSDSLEAEVRTYYGLAD